MRAREPALSDGAMLLMIGLLAGLLLGIWVWIGLGCALQSGEWVALSPGRVALAALRLPAHLAHPDRAFPAGIRRQLPAPVPFWSLGAVLLALAALLARTAARAARPGGSGARAIRAAGTRGAAWASRADLADLRSRRGLRSRARWPRPACAEGARLGLGFGPGGLLRAERRHALVAFGPPQSGKSAGLAVPALLEWPGPAVASSIKGDLLTATERCRRRLGQVLIFDPFALSGRPSSTWSPLREAGSWDGALTVAARLASAAELDQRGVEGGDFWSVAAEQRLAPLLFAAARGGGDMTAVVRWAYGQAGRGLRDALDLLLRDAPDEQSREDAQAAYDACEAFAAQADRTRASVEATVQAMLRAYRFAGVRRSAAGCEITGKRLLDEAATLYLIGDAKAAKLLRPIFLALLQEVIDCAYRRATEGGGALERPLLLCLDEAGNVAPLPYLAEVASTAPSHNIQLVTIFHDLAQARARYQGQAETVINSHRARMLLPGVADLETLRLFSGLVGEAERAELTRTTGSAGSSRASARRRVPLIAPEALRQLPRDHAVLLYGRLPPARVRLRMWFADPALRRRASAA